MTLVGYNNHSYDDAMLRYVMTHKGTSINTNLHTVSGKLVDDNYRGDKDLLKLRYPRDVFFKWDSIDLMKILAFDKLGISLKQVAINLKWHKIQDMPVDHDATVTIEQLPTVLDYNLNDVLITKRLYEDITPIRKLRDDLSMLYGINLSSASDSKMGNLIFEHIYANELKMDIRAVRDLRTPRDKVYLKDCIAPFVTFKTRQLQELQARLASTIVYNYTNFRYSEKVHFANCSFSLGIGGLHSEDAPGVFISDEKSTIQDMDVASYYPNLIINNNFYPEHLGQNFIRVLKKITQERMSAKHAGDKVKADGLKITVNSIFGKLGSETFWLLDPKQMLSTTVTGQLGLLMLIEDLHLNGIEVISCNTDGVVCRIPKDLEEKYYEVAKNWEKATSLELEFTAYKKYVRRDVNSYITEKQDGTTKEKGAFLKEVDLKKAYHMPIVPKALYAYFIKDIPIRQTLEECKDIMEFCISQKTGGNFVLTLVTTKGSTSLQKTNRFFISKRGGSLVKKETFGKRAIGLHVGRNATILNDYDEKLPFEQYDVDLGFYEKEVMKIIDEIEPKQLTLFDFSGMDKGAKTKAEMPVQKVEELQEEILTIEELNKLGKNQLVKKLEDLVKKGERILDASPRCVYVVNYDTRNSDATLYCFSKGIYMDLKVKKETFKKTPFEKGNVIYCKKFAKENNEHVITDYTLTNKIEREKTTLL